MTAATASTDISVRRATLADVEAIRSVGLRTWPPTYGPILGDAHVAAGLAQWWSVETVTRGVETLETFVAEAAGEVIGTAVLGQLDDSPMLWKLYVLPEHQRRGAGGRLLAAALASACGDTVQLDCAEGNDRAYGFYLAHGFREVTRHTATDGHLEIRMARTVSTNPSR